MIDLSIPKTHDCLNYQSIHNLQQLQRRIPIIGDKILLYFVNSIQLNRDRIIDYKNIGLLKYFFAEFNSNKFQHNSLNHDNSIISQSIFNNVIAQLYECLDISQLGLQITQQILIQLRDIIRTQKHKFAHQQQAILKLSSQLHELAQQVGNKLHCQETQWQQIGIRAAAKSDLESIITAWQTGQAYTNLPWIIQVTFLAREVFSSAVVSYELETGDTKYFRSLLVDKIMATSQQIPQNFIDVTELLDSCWQVMENSDRTVPIQASHYLTDNPSLRDRNLAAVLLEVRSIPQSRLFNMPLLFTIGTTLELATLPDTVRPTKPAQLATILCQNYFSSIAQITDAQEFVTAIVEETANDSIAALT